jgi:uncharacterized protein
VIEYFLNGLAPSIAVVLVLSATLTSLFTASFGAGGGVMLLGVMAQILPPQLVIPLHGVVQLGSNAGRAAMSFRHIDVKFILEFLPGAVIGALIGSFVLLSLPVAIIYLSIAGFILYLCWGPPLPRLIMGRWGPAAVGLVTTFLTLFVGATGPLIGAFLKQVFVERFRIVATFAAAMTLQHVSKIIVFTGAGFDLVPWMPLLLAMVAGGAFGTWLGLHVLRRMPDRHFKRLFNWLLTLLAVRLIWQAIMSF